LSSVLGMRRKWRFTGSEDHTVARKRKERPVNLVIPSVARDLGFAGTSPALGSPNVSRCGNHLEILWEAPIDGITPAESDGRKSTDDGWTAPG